MAILLFECNPLSMGGIKKLKLATRKTDESPIDFPLDVVYKTNDESTLLISDDEDNRKLTIGGQEIEYRIVYPNNSSIIEDEVNDRQGTFYTQTLAFDLPQVSLTTSNQLKSFLFTTDGEFAISNMLALIEDMNDVLWLVGYVQPMILETFELTTGVNAEDNVYNITYKCKTYSKIRHVEII